MKLIKVLVAALMVAAGSSMFAAVPEFTGPGANAVVLDARATKDPYQDFMQIINFTDDKNVTFKVYGWNKKTDWTELGTSTVQAYGDSENLESEYNHKLNKYEAFAIVPSNGKAYKYEFTKFKINMYVVMHYCCAVRVVPESVTLPKNAYSFEAKSVKGSFKDRIKVEAEDESNVLDGKSFAVYGSNDNETWEVVAGVTVKNDGSYCESVNEAKVAKYKYYAIANREGKTFTYTVSKSHNDLYFKVK